MSDHEFGGSWWGQKWIDSLERLSTAWQNRLPRGRDYASKGHVIALAVTNGKITAKVQGSRSKPYSTSIEVPTIRVEHWDGLIERLASEARFAAQLMSGEMPADIEELFSDINLNLFPARNSELISQCSCPDKARPCKHIAAVHYAFGKALDRDPFLLFELRGAGRETLFRGFHRAWFGDESLEGGDSLAPEVHEISTGIAVEPLSADRFNRSPHDEEDLTFVVKGPEEPLFVLKRLGAPMNWDLPVHISDLLGPVTEAAGTLAMQIAVAGGAEDGLEVLDKIVTDEDESGADAEALGTVFRRVTAGGADEQAPSPEVSELPDVLPSAAHILPGALGRKSGEADKKSTVRKRKKMEPSVLIRRNRGDKNKSSRPRVDAEKPTATSIKTNTPEPTVRKRRRAVGVGAGSSGRGMSAVALDTQWRQAWVAGDDEAALAAARGAWRASADERRFQMLVASADRVGTIGDLIAEEVKPICDDAIRAGRRLNTPQLLMLLMAGEYEVVTDLVVGMGDEVWTADDPVGLVFLPFALMALIGERSVPEETAMSELWDALFCRGEDSFGELEDTPAPVGVWLEWALDAEGITPELHERLELIVKQMALGLLEIARSKPVPMKPRVVAANALAVGEAVSMFAGESEADSFVAIAVARGAADVTLGKAMSGVLKDSPLL